MKQTLQIKCRGAGTMSITQLTAIQGQLKILTEENYRRLRKELETVGFIEPVSIWENTIGDCTLYILNGHQRVETLRRMSLDGWSIPQIPINWVEADDLEDAKRKVLALASQYGTVTKEGLSDFMSDLELTLEDFDAQFNFPEINVMELDFGKPKTTTVAAHERTIGKTDDDAVPEQVASIAQHGDIFQLGNHRLMCGDSTSIKDVEKLMNGSKAELVFTDPPYGVSYQSNMRTKTKKFEVIENDDTFLTEWIKVLPLVSSGWVFVWTTWRVLGRWFEITAPLGNMTNMIVWSKGGGGMGFLEGSFANDHELALVFNRGAKITGKRIGSVWSVGKDRPTEYMHPTQKPVVLSEMAIDSVTNPGGIVLDLFGGSGSTLIGCEKTGRACYMMELDEKYCDVIIARWEAFTGKNAVKVGTAAPIKRGGKN